ncbi:EAL domain-containing protein [Aliiglaciecola sp. CAU 1673]|uniref:EAL domain-containing protein n=1 Tax=Aliiglaciecola sp. CAU 1673 TaxID=3032595 RepID=UPI0023DBE6E9|nr:EAL domain-containing protein [Aliiglaciecola sp. CAU 1673]MDF2177843.1 EAL domain-containing protein [Aliiglaciecola sp. CAU 1673]
MHSAVAQQEIPSVNLDEQTLQLDLLPNLQFLRTDSTNQLSTVQTLDGWTRSGDFSPLPQNQSLWARISLHQQSNGSMRYGLLLANPTLDEVDVYLLDDKGRIRRSLLMGASRPFSARELNHRDFLVPLELLPGDKMDVYIRINDKGPLVLPIKLWRYSELIGQEQLNLALLGVVGGALIMLALYYLVSYTLLHSPVRFWFSLSNLCFLLLFLNVEGILAQMLRISAFISELTLVLVAFALTASAKVAHLMLVKVPAYWRYCSYILSLLLLATPFVLDQYWQIIAAIGFAGASLCLQLLLAWQFRDKGHGRPNRLYAIGWSTVALACLLSSGLYLLGMVLEEKQGLILTFVALFGVLLIALAVEIHEQGKALSHYELQRSTISDLRRFYDLFRNSAEGLYTSTLNGKLITTNPAMCSLFGYENEQQMLSECRNTSQLYANQADRQALLEEIKKNGVVLGKEIRGVKRNGSEFWFSISVQMRRENKEEFMFGAIADITERKESNMSLEYMATHDPLTGVYNRREFERRLRKALRNAESQDSELTLLYMDLDQFKVVNDTCGHKAGDVLIKQLSQQLNQVVETKGLLARLGGDEFGVLLESDQANDQNAYLLANKILNVVQQFRFFWENRIFTLGISIGLVPYTKQVHSPEQLLSMADSACYMAKEQGRNQIHTYSKKDDKIQRYETELHWVSLINKALTENRFELYYQHYHPLAKLAQGYHYEILLRMQGDEGEQLVSPGLFMPAAERYNLTAQIDRWVIEHYFQWLSQNPEHKEQLIRANINLSGHSLGDKELRLFVLNAFEKYGIPYQKVCFEITESMAIIKMDETLQFIKTFHQLGCRFALDDFGSGFSSYGYLKSLPVNYVKIDGGFVKDLLNDPVSMAMVSSIKEVAKAMGMKTVAEFVESKEIMVELGKMGVDYAQGYGVAKPAALSEFQPLTSG